MAELVRYPNPALTQKAEPRPVDAQMLAVGAALLAATDEVQAYGLAAAHIGANEPLIVISVTADRNARDYRVLYNPDVTLMAEETEMGAEGSVSTPGIEAPIERAVWADVAFDDANGIRHTERYSGFVARVALHEIDQMNGLFFLSRLSRLKRDTALRKFAKSQRG